MFVGCGSPELYRNVYAEKQTLFYSIGDLFVPETVINTYRMRDFISSDYFANYKQLNGDLKAIDEMYDYAQWITDEDIQQSLFIITLSTLPYKRTPAKIPVVNLDMMFYFSMESDSSFKKRYHNLPAHFFSDSPVNNFGDKDKMPHYFGSAFITYSSDAKFLSNYIGDLIEMGEAFFSLEGFNDERDRKANGLGAQFGSGLLKNPDTKPSEFILKWKK